MSDMFQTFGKYRLARRLAFGGMAEVFLGTVHGEAGFTKPVVIKRLHPRLNEDQEFVQMLIDEARLTAQLAHSNICQVLDLGSVEGSYYIALEYIAGEDLRALQDQCRRQDRMLPISTAIFIVAEALAGLDYAHRKEGPDGTPLGVIHRDVSPQNIIVSYEGEVKVIDFGIAKARSRLVQTEHGVIKGKFRYMSPEQASGGQIDHRTDIFAAGVVLYELLRGEPHSMQVADTEVLRRMRRAEFDPLHEFRKDIPRPLERALKQALAVKPHRRFATAGEFRAALLSVLTELGVHYGRSELAVLMQDLFDATRRRERSGSVQTGVQRTREPDAFTPFAAMESPAPRRDSAPAPDKKTSSERRLGDRRAAPQPGVDADPSPRPARSAVKADRSSVRAVTSPFTRSEDDEPNADEEEVLLATSLRAREPASYPDANAPLLLDEAPATQLPARAPGRGGWPPEPAPEDADPTLAARTRVALVPDLTESLEDEPAPGRGGWTKLRFEGQAARYTGLTTHADDDEAVATRMRGFAAEPNGRPAVAGRPEDRQYGVRTVLEEGAARGGPPSPLARGAQGSATAVIPDETARDSHARRGAEHDGPGHPLMRTFVGLGMVLVLGTIVAIGLSYWDRLTSKAGGESSVVEDAHNVTLDGGSAGRTAGQGSGASGSAVPAGYGLVRVRSTPSGAHIRVCGRRTKLVTPAEVPVPFGERCTLGLSLKGYERFELPVQAAAGSTPLVGARLQRRTGPPLRAPRPKAQAPSEQPAAKGTLRVTSVQVGTVFVQDRPVGQTPVVTIPLDPGVYHVRMHFSALDRQSRVHQVEIHAGQTTKLHITPEL